MSTTIFFVVGLTLVHSARGENGFGGQCRRIHVARSLPSFFSRMIRSWRWRMSSSFHCSCMSFKADTRQLLDEISRRTSPILLPRPILPKDLLRLPAPCTGKKARSYPRLPITASNQKTGRSRRLPRNGSSSLVSHLSSTIHLSSGRTPGRKHLLSRPVNPFPQSFKGLLVVPWKLCNHLLQSAGKKRQWRAHLGASNSNSSSISEALCSVALPLSCSSVEI